MGPIKVSLLFAVYFVLLFCPSYADTIDIQLTFDQEEVILSNEMGYDTVDYPNTIQMSDLGKPSLPMTSAYASLPFNSTISSVSIVSSQTQDISGNFFIYPAQVPENTGEYTTKAEFTLPDPSVYNEEAFYPENPYSDPYISNFVGATMGVVYVYPFRYNPVDRDLEIYTSLTLRLTYNPPSPPPTAERYMEDCNLDLIIENIKSRVTNPDDVEDNYEPVNIFNFSESNPSGYSLDAPDMNDNISKPSDMTYPYTYVIITNDKYVSFLPSPETIGIPAECTPLSNWRTELGLPATMRTVNWIISEYWTQPSEYDLQTAIRSFLYDAHEYWGTQWLILIGDVNSTVELPDTDGEASDGYVAIVPVRFLCSDDVTAPSTPEWGEYMPCDLYYMNLTDDFNSDGDMYYGEPIDIDDPDFTYAIDLFGARVPADTDTEVEKFIEKLLHYEKLDFILSQANTYLSRCLQICADFGNKDLPELEEPLDLLPCFSVDYIFEGFQDDPDNAGNWDARFPDYPEPWQVVEALNDPSGIVNLALHGNVLGYYILTHESFWPAHCQYIQFLAATHDNTNKYDHSWNFDKALEDVDISPKYSFFYSASCQLHRYEDNIKGAFSEEFLFNPSWGGPIAVGNVRSSPHDDTKDFMEDFYDFLMKKTSDYIDDTCYSGNVQCDTLSKNWSLHLKMTYMNQLFGCPRTPIWRGDPQTFDEPATDFSGGILTITIEDNNVPVENATVCLWMKNDPTKKYFVYVTDENGEVEFNIGLGGCSNATLTVSYELYNYKPYQTTITVP